ncbi:MAG: hypothetical protein LM601_11760, partial [Candidatus Verstraetearchaeota archaeon]|nr:hypothetical protein [Candidatus Verstraetearchaeota archaeon]
SKALAEKFRRYVAERYGLKRGSITKAIVDLIEEKLSEVEQSAIGTVDSIAGLGLKSDYMWSGKDLVEALKRVNTSGER